MSIMDKNSERFNIPTPTLGGEVFWDILEKENGYVLQKNKVDGHCRILNMNSKSKIRIAHGEEGPMRAKMFTLNPNFFRLLPRRGDIIGVQRQGGIYDHYGVYEDDSHIYEYSAPNGDFSPGNESIHTTTLQNFVRDSGNYFILIFPKSYGVPGKIWMTSSRISAGLRLGDPFHGIKKLFLADNYHLYSPDETIQRAKQKLNESNYNLFFNNCEHYAIWCKTGLKESHQAGNILI